MISKERHEEARVILQRLHDDHEDTLFWEKEYLQIAAQAAAEAEEKKTSKWTHIVTNKKELHRILIAIVAMTCVQTNGAQTIQAYQVSPILPLFKSSHRANIHLQATLYSGLGFSARSTLLMAGIFQICLIAGGLVNLALIDRAGRRILFLSGLLILSVCLALFAAFSAKFGQTADNCKCSTGCSFTLDANYWNDSLG